MSTPTAQLADFLMSAQPSVREQRRCLQRLPGGTGVLRSVAEGLSLADHSFDVVERLRARGLLNRTFFDALARQVGPERFADVVTVAGAWGVHDVAAAVASLAPMGPRPAAPAQAAANTVTIHGGDLRGAVIAPGAGQVVMGGVAPVPAPAAPPRRLPTISTDPVDVFLGHAGPDEVLARQLDGALRSRGLSVFLALDDVGLGQSWDDAIPAAQRTARLSLLLLTPNAPRAHYLRSEVQTALARHRRDGHLVVPVLSGVRQDDPELVYGLNVVKAVDLGQLGVAGVADAVAGALRGAGREVEGLSSDVPVEGREQAEARSSLPDPAQLVGAGQVLMNGVKQVSQSVKARREQRVLAALSRPATAEHLSAAAGFNLKRIQQILGRLIEQRRVTFDPATMQFRRLGPVE